MAAVPALAFVNDRDIFANMRPAPVPALKAVLDGFAAMIAVEIGTALPRYVWAIHLHLDTRTRRDGLPMVTTGRIQFKAAFVEHFGVQNDLPLHPPPPWNAEPDITFFNVDYQSVFVPAHGAWPDAERIALLPCVARTPFGHHPTGTLSVQSDVQAAMVRRNIATRFLVIRREDAADKTDNGQPVASVIAERVDIPPAVALRWYHGVEIRSDSRASLAWAPDKAAIGTPAPGWVAPPAQ